MALYSAGCSQGHLGPLCGTCDTDMGYRINKQGQCYVCGGDQSKFMQQLAIFAILSLITFALALRFKKFT